MEITPQDHHNQSELCYTRPPYRQGKEFKAVKVYTINNESNHLLMHNVPSIGLLKEIKRLTVKFGKTEVVKQLKDYPVVKTEFTDVYYVKYKSLKDARQAKKRLDNRSFFGNILHVCYAPELESVDECRNKLLERHKFFQKQSHGPNSKVSKSKVSRSSNSHELGKSTSNTTETANHLSDSQSSQVGTWSNLISSSSTKVISLNHS